MHSKQTSQRMARFPDKSHSHTPLARLLSIIDYDGSPIRYLIMDCPTETTLGYYLDTFAQFNVTHVVRCCQPTYSAQRLEEHHIQLSDLPFRDGGMPPQWIVQEWLQLIRNMSADDISVSLPKEQRPTVVVHCVAGLGRAPVLVAIALIEAGMEPLDAIEFIRSKRRGAFNKPQIAYLDQYKRTPKPGSKQESFRSSLGRMFRMGKPANAVSQQT